MADYRAWWLWVDPVNYNSSHTSTLWLYSPFLCGVGLTPPLGPFFRSPRFRFLRCLCSSPLGPCKSQHCGHTLAYWAFPGWYMRWLWSNWWSERRLQGKPKNSEKTCPRATLSHHKSNMTRSGFEARTAAVGSQRLTAWAMARPLFSPLLNLGNFFSFLILYTVGWIPWTGDQPVARPLPAHRTA
jgi:hypothetical protein